MRKHLFTAFALVLLLTVATVLVVPTVTVAEPNSAESSAVQVINVQDYLAADSQIDVARQQELYDILGFSSEQDITALEKQMLASAERVQIASETHRLAFGKSITITSRMYRIPSLDQEKEKGYFVSLTAAWNGMPLYRMQDVLALSTANRVVYGPTSQRYLDLSYRSVSYSGGRTEKAVHHYDWMNPYTPVFGEKMVAEGVPGLYGYGMQVKLPADVNTRDAQIQCYDLQIRLQTTIYSQEEFYLETIYGHHYLAGNPRVTSKGGEKIRFDRNTAVYRGEMISTAELWEKQ